MTVILRGSLSRPNANTNPADFNYREFLRRKGVESLLYVRGLENCHIQDFRSTPIAVVRNWFKDAIEASVPPSTRALPTALITGDRSGLDASTRQDFAVSGLMHLLAISGLHVLFVGLAAYGLLKSMLIRLRFDWRFTEAVSSAITLALLLIYSLMTGATPSVVRASIMAAVFLSSRPLFRTPNGLNSLGVAATVVLLLDPDSLFTAGFQLSFLAVFGLITAGAFVTSAVNQKVFRPSARWCLGLLGASAVATLSTSPVMMFHFGYVPLAGLVLNLVAIPLASVLLVSSIFTSVLPEIEVVLGTMANA
jgi:competence protein ComEC